MEEFNRLALIDNYLKQHEVITEEQKAKYKKYLNSLDKLEKKHNDSNITRKHRKI